MTGDIILLASTETGTSTTGMIDQLITSIQGKNGLLWYILTTGVLIVIAEYIVLFLLRRFFKRLKKVKRGIHITFLERLLQVLVVIIGVLVLIFTYVGHGRLWQTVFGSTVLIGGIIGIAGQDVLKDVLAGLMLSLYKPFDLGDRIRVPELPRAVVVEDMTMRHVVLRARDGMRFIIPNSEINKQSITHTNKDHMNRATYIYVPVGFNSDLRKVIKLMRQAAKECPYTCPNNQNNKDLDGYGDAYLVSLGDSAINMEMTIWSEPGMDNDFVVSEVYQAIIRLFAENNIEIPYNFLNLIQREDPGMYYDKNQSSVAIREMDTRTDIVRINGNLDDSVEAVLVQASRFSEFHALDPKAKSMVSLLSEEILAFMDKVVGEASGRFWIEGNKKRFSIHLRSTVDISLDKKKELVSISSDGTNSISLGIIGRIRDIIYRGVSDTNGVTFSLKNSDEIKNIDGYEKMLITRLSDDVQVSVLGDKVEIIIVKKVNK